VPRNVRYSLLLLLLVLLTVPLKLFYAPPLPNPDEQRLADDIAAMLQSKGFALSFGEMVDVPTITARKPNCNLLVTRVGSTGYSNARFGIASESFGPTNFHYDGRLTQDFPRFWPLINEHLHRWLEPVGLEQKIPPVLAIAGQAMCNGEVLDWSRFRLYQKS